MATTATPRWVGRSFVHPSFDYLLIGGGLSLLFTAAILLVPNRDNLVGWGVLPYVLLLSTTAHFAASTVRLYSKPGTREALPFLTMGFPLVSLGVLTLAIAFAANLGTHLQSLYLTWSPYHYAAQAYGLAVMYSHRSGCHLKLGDKRWLRWIAMLPFFYNFMSADGVGLRWLARAAGIELGGIADALQTIGWILTALAIAGPLYFVWRVRQRYDHPLPLISLLSVVANGVWFFVLAPLQAFVFATIFHGIQYMAIVIIFHVRDQMGRPENRRGIGFHVVTFYAMCLALGYALFSALPQAYIFAGFGRVESVLLVVAAINIHHFIVDAYIWKLERDQGNRRVVESGTPVAA